MKWTNRHEAVIVPVPGGSQSTLEPNLHPVLPPALQNRACHCCSQVTGEETQTPRSYCDNPWSLSWSLFHSNCRWPYQGELQCDRGQRKYSLMLGSWVTIFRGWDEFMLSGPSPALLPTAEEQSCPSNTVCMRSMLLASPCVASPAFSPFSSSLDLCLVPWLSLTC